MDGYTQTKLESERMVVEYQKSYNLPIVILRPGFIYGPRDRSWLPKVIDALEKRMVRYISGGHTALNSTYVLNLTHAMMLALDNSNAVGQIYNITDGEFVSKRRVFETVADFFGLKRPSRSIPLWLARIAARIMERRARRRGAKEAPRLTQARLKFLGLNLGFSIAKARKELGYTPPTSFQDAFQATLEWFRKERAAKSGN
jgi:nucleoside-diphosphate-sugar epimerase